MSDPERILIIRPSALGDVCRTVPVLASLRRAHPEARIDWVVQEEFAPVVAAHPDLDRVVSFPRSRFRDWWRNPGRAAEVRAWFGTLRAARYDLVVDCQGLGRSGLMVRATRAPRRIGWRDAREMAWLAYTHRVESDAVGHTVDRMLDLVRACGVDAVPDMRLHAGERDAAQWERDRASSGLGGRIAVLAATARWASKRWPIERWTTLADPLVERGFEHLVVVGAPHEREQVASLLGSHPAIVDRAGRSGLGGLMAIVASADIVIANDSAPLHMAVGFDRPCVGLFGPTDPSRVGPYGRPEAVVRRYRPRPGERVNYRDARIGDGPMRAITTADVVAGIDRVLTAPVAEVDPCV